MNHNHTVCEHSISYCEKCDVCYCTKCNKEWCQKPNVGSSQPWNPWGAGNGMNGGSNMQLCSTSHNHG